MKTHVFSGFGFGPIQAGLFVAEAFCSGNFRRIAIAEVDAELVSTVRENRGRYCVNIASETKIEPMWIDGVEMYDLCSSKDRKQFLDALARSTDICTSLPSVDFYDRGENSVAALLAEGFLNRQAEAACIYTAENNNRAAEILEHAVFARMDHMPEWVQFLNTVIGKMSQVVTNPEEIRRKKLTPIVPGFPKAFLVEEFNRILVTRCGISGFTPGIPAFEEKDNLLPFEEAKLYGHNAIHALLGFLGESRGYTTLAELAHDKEIMKTARSAFLDEIGAALVKKYRHLDDSLFSPEGFKHYADDLLRRITNPNLNDTIERAVRDPERKLRADDRLFGAMRLCLEFGVKPENLAAGAAAGIIHLNQSADMNAFRRKLSAIFSGTTDACVDKIIPLVEFALQSKLPAIR